MRFVTHLIFIFLVSLILFVVIVAGIALAACVFTIVLLVEILAALDARKSR